MSFNADLRKNTVKLESFGFKIDKLYLRDIVLTNQLFSQLDDDDINEVTSKHHIIERPKNSTLFAQGEKAQGIYIVITGIANEQYSENQTATVNLGTIVGVNVMIDDDSKYDTTVTCESRCTFIFVSIHQMQKYANNYSDFETTVYENYFLHKIHFLTEYPRLVEVS